LLTSAAEGAGEKKMGKELKQKILLFFAGEESSCILHILKVQSEKSNTFI
jgi:hypothetical protein